jgi:hypothetical protein
MEKPESDKPSPGFWKPGAAAPEGLCGIGTGQFDRETEKEDLVRHEICFLNWNLVNAMSQPARLSGGT